MAPRVAALGELLVEFVAEEVREYLAQLGFRSLA